jgi:outer membrane protein
MEDSMRQLKSLCVPAFVAALAASLIFCVGQASAQDSRVAVVDLDKAVGDSKQGQQAKQKIDAKRDQLEKGLQKKRDDFEKKVNDFRIQAEAMNDDARNKKQREIEGDRDTLVEQLRKSDEELDKTLRDNMQPLYEKARDAAVRLGKERGCSLVLTLPQIQILSADVNLTDEVTKAIDRR